MVNFDYETKLIFYKRGYYRRSSLFSFFISLPGPAVIYLCGMFRPFPDTSCYLEWLQGWINLIWQGQNCCVLSCLIVLCFLIPIHVVLACALMRREGTYGRGAHSYSENLCLWYNYYISKIPIKLQFEIHTKTKNLLLEQDDARLNYT